MEGLGGLFSDIFGWLRQGSNPATGAGANWMKLLTGGLLGAGELGNILQGHKQTAMQDFMAKLAQNPALLSQMILKAKQPISTALSQAINNRVQGDMAARGLAQAPGIFAGTEAQALAPFEQANYNAAQEQVMRQLGLWGNTVSGQQPANLSPAMWAFMRSFGTGTGTGGQTTPVISVPPQSPPEPGITPPGEVYGVPPGSSWPPLPNTSDWGWGTP